MRETAARKAAQAKGQRAEALCAWILRLKGYRILAHSYRSPVGEIDIVAKKNDLVVFVEVKARPTKPLAFEAVTPQQRQRIERAAQVFLQKHGLSPCNGVRFDVMAVLPWQFPEHLKDAWRPDF